MSRSDERGMAIIVAMFMMLMVSALGAAMVHVARTETLSSTNYASMSQARYAAESGVAAAAHYLLSSEFTTIGDDLTNYDTLTSPVRRSGGIQVAGDSTVRLSSDSALSNYPNGDVVADFAERTSGSLPVGRGDVRYSARATLLGIRQFTDGISGQTRMLRIWEITGVGRRAAGEGSGDVEVSAIIERGTRPVFNYAAFAQANGCNAMIFRGNAFTGSYDSSTAPVGATPPTTTSSGGNIGTNGNLGEWGNAIVNGTLSTPQSGVGTCTANNVTAATIGPNASVTGGLVQLPQSIEFPPPVPPSPAPGETTQVLSGANCEGLPACNVVNGSPTFSPTGSPVLLGNLAIQGQAVVTLKGGIYHINSLSITGQARIQIDPTSGPVTIKLAGAPANSTTPVLYVAGGGISNTSWKPEHLRIEYQGQRTVRMAGTGNTAAIVYAPNAHGVFEGEGAFYGAVVTRTIDSSGNGGVYYDRNLQNSNLTTANPVMSTFTWRTF